MDWAAKLIGWKKRRKGDSERKRLIDRWKTKSRWTVIDTRTNGPTDEPIDEQVDG